MHLSAGWRHLRMWTRSYNVTQEQKDLIAMSSKEFDTYMCEQFPKQFAQRHLPMTETCMCWGFAIGPGWRPLLKELCDNIKLITDKYPINVEFEQIKEKFGTARFYTRTYIEMNDEGSVEFKIAEKASKLIDEIVSYAEDVTDNICAETGEWYDEKIRIGGWVYDVSPKQLIKQDPERYKDTVEHILKLRKLTQEIKYLCEGSSIETLEKIKQMLKSNE